MNRLEGDERLDRCVEHLTRHHAGRDDGIGRKVEDGVEPPYTKPGLVGLGATNADHVTNPKRMALDVARDHDADEKS
jgi:hypothetical protein